MSKKLTKNDFILKAMKVHGNRYDYSNVDYKNARTHVVIKCKLHNINFNQTPDNHLHGKGCYWCGLKKQVNDRTLTLDDFIKKSNKIHKNKYNYSNINYINNHTKIKIVCPLHGEFSQTPSNHLSGYGCSICVYRISDNEIDFLDYYNVPTNNRQKYILSYNVDGFDLTTNTIYEFLGDYWHGNPKKYKTNERNEKTKCKFGELYCKTLERFNKLKKSGYNIKYIWEYDWKKFKKGIDKLPDIQTYGIIK